MTWRDEQTVWDMAERLRHLVDASSRDIEEFLGDHFFNQGVVKDFEVIGEAAKRVSPALRDAHPDVPWRDMARFRDLLVHRYEKVDYPEVWRFVQEEAAPILAALERLQDAQGWRR